MGQVFLETLVRRNGPLVEAAIQLHQQGLIPANSYVLDLDQVKTNAKIFAAEADRHGLTTFPMTKQVGRNPAFLQVLADVGLDRFVAVDMNGARRIHAEGHRIGHLGHLVQVPRAESEAAASMVPEFWTVYSHDKAQLVSRAAGNVGITQKVMARVFAPGDIFYMGHEGGFAAEDIVAVADRLDGLPHVGFAGITSFPALLFDETAGTVGGTTNLQTLERAAETLRRSGRDHIEINAPGTTSTEVLSILASAGATQVEPGHGLTGTTPLHAVRDLPEAPAILYLSEISHFHGGKAYCFGGGMYIDPVFSEYQVKALVGSDGEQALSDRIHATLPPPEAIDYYGLLDVPKRRALEAGDSVVFGFRIQAFVAHAFVVALRGVHSGDPVVEGVWWSDGSTASWPT